MRDADVSSMFRPKISDRSRIIASRMYRDPLYYTLEDSNEFMDVQEGRARSARVTRNKNGEMASKEARSISP